MIVVEICGCQMRSGEVFVVPLVAVVGLGDGEQGQGGFLLSQSQVLQRCQIGSLIRHFCHGSLVRQRFKESQEIY